MDSKPFTSPGDSLSRADDELDNIALLQDAVPQLESLFNISHCIGHGTFSSVYLARTKHTTTINGRRHFAIKHIIPTSHPSRVFMELRCLKLIGGADNVMDVTMCFREMNHIVLVMPYFPHDSFGEYVGYLSTYELQDYLINLLIALRRVHSFRIIHRDVKPANFLFNRKHRRYSLVDFGLAQEVGQTRRANPGNGGKLYCEKEPASKLLLPPILDTPHLASNKTVKRKLGVSSGEVVDNERSKRPCLHSSPTSAVSGILSSTTSRVNTLLRRSPRKQCAIPVSPKKENFGAVIKVEQRSTPKKIQQNPVPQEAVLDSPSKHTRNAEAYRKRETQNNDLGINNIHQVKNETVQNLRRSPRKLCSTTIPSIPLEGLAKHLQDVTTLHDKKQRRVANANSATTARNKKGKEEDSSPNTWKLRRKPGSAGAPSAARNSHLLGQQAEAHASAFQTTCNRTSTQKAGRSKAGLNSGCDPSFASRTFSQRHRQSHGVMTCSPRVSGIVGTPDQNGVLSKSAKSGRVLQEVQTRTGSVLKPVSCHCYGSARVCGVCAGRSNQVAPRAGTPGFRAPEVLLRHPDQGTAVDMWSVGIILLCLLSGRYPFFRAADDLSTLAEIITLLGTNTVRKAAAKLGKLLTCSEDKKPLDLMKVCEILRNKTVNKEVCGNATLKMEPCVGCHQQDICVCLIPPTKPSSSSQVSGNHSKKRTQMQDSISQKKNLMPSGTMHLSPTKKKIKVQITQKSQYEYFVGYSREELISYINETSSAGIDSQHIFDKADAHTAKTSSTCSKKEVIENLPYGIPQKMSRNSSVSPVGDVSSTVTGPCLYPPLVYHLLLRLLDPNPDSRITAEEALAHPFLKSQSIHGCL